MHTVDSRAAAAPPVSTLQVSALQLLCACQCFRPQLCGYTAYAHTSDLETLLLWASLHPAHTNAAVGVPALQALVPLPPWTPKIMILPCMPILQNSEPWPLHRCCALDSVQACSQARTSAKRDSFGHDFPVGRKIDQRDPRSLCHWKFQHLSPSFAIENSNILHHQWGYPQSCLLGLPEIFANIEFTWQGCTETMLQCPYGSQNNHNLLSLCLCTHL